MDQTLLFFGVCFGLIFGSFLNALIYRIPNGIGLFLPRSFCPKCGKTIPWYENIPVLSYIALRGSCSNCKTDINWTMTHGEDEINIFNNFFIVISNFFF